MLYVPDGRPKGLPYPTPEDFLETRRGGDDSPCQGADFPLSGGNGRRSKGVGMMSRSDRGDRDRYRAHARRMRRQSEEQVSLEKLCRAGARPRRVCPFPFRECGEDFAAPAASDFLDGQKVTKDPLGGGRNRQKRLRRPCLHAARPLGPRYGGRVPAGFCRITGAQNLSGALNSSRATGP